MSIRQQLAEEGVPVDRHEDEDGFVLAADFGPQTDAQVDIAGSTVIVVTASDQHEFEVEGDSQAFMQNGVLTIEVEK